MEAEKTKKSDWVYVIIAVVIAVDVLFLPKSGHFALVNVAVNCGLLWSLGIYLTVKVIKSGAGIKKNFFTYAFCLLFCLAALWATKNFVVDLVTGPKTVVLQNVSSSTLRGRKGSKFHYYLNGYDSAGKKYKIEISSKEYSNMSHGNSVVVTYYENTKKMYEMGS